MAYNILSGDEIREAILKEARRQFFEKGITKTQMKDIAKAVKIGRSTLYRYYQHKEQLAMAITSGLIELISGNAQKTISARNLTGYEQLQLFCRQYVDNLKGNVKLLNYFSEFDRIFETTYPDFTDSESFVRIMKEHLMVISEFIRCGIRDKSIASGSDPDLLSSVIVNIILGVAQRVLPRSKHIMEEHGYDGETIIVQSVELILSGLKA